MAPDRIVFAMANPVPEVAPEEVRDDVAIMATGRSDYPNQINNVLAFPGMFRGALDVRARTDQRGDEARRRQGDRRVIPADELTPTTSSRACSTAGWPPPSRRPWPRRRWRRAWRAGERRARADHATGVAGLTAVPGRRSTLRFTIGAASRHGCPRSPGQGGSGVVALTPGVTGRTSPTAATGRARCGPARCRAGARSRTPTWAGPRHRREDHAQARTAR